MANVSMPKEEIKPATSAQSKKRRRKILLKKPWKQNSLDGTLSSRSRNGIAPNLLTADERK